MLLLRAYVVIFFFQAEDGIRDIGVTGVQTCALPISGVHLLERPCAAGTSADAAGCTRARSARGCLGACVRCHGRGVRRYDAGPPRAYGATPPVAQAVWSATGGLSGSASQNGGHGARVSTPRGA